MTSSLYFLLVFIPGLTLSHIILPHENPHEHHEIPFADYHIDKVNWNLGDGEKNGTLTVNTTAVHGGEWVSVRWDNFYVKNGDWIGLFPSVTVNLEEFAGVAPMKFKVMSKHVCCSVNFILENYRQPVKFVYVRQAKVGAFPTILAISDDVDMIDAYLPMQPHLMLPSHPYSKSKPNYMHLIWTAKAYNSPMVKWGTSPGKYDFFNAAEPSTFTDKDMCDVDRQPAGTYGWLDPGYKLKTTMYDLQWGSTYYYICGDEKYGWSEEMTFKAPKAPGSPSKMYAFADMGQVQADGSWQHSWDWESQGELPTLNLTRSIWEKEDVDFVFHSGDISYAVGYLWEWENFMHQITPLAKRVPYQVAIGNHEQAVMGSFLSGTDSGGECGVPYNANFPYASQNSSAPWPEREPWYSFEYGNVHVTVMSTEHPWDEGSDQYKFIENDLKSINRTERPWVVFAGHRPMYIASSWSGDEDMGATLRKPLEPLMEKYEVNIALWGHYHGYQRSCAAIGGDCKDGGVVHQVIGMAGYEMQPTQLPKPAEWPTYTEIATNQYYGYVTYDFVDERSCHIQFHADDGSEKVVDDFWIHR